MPPAHERTIGPGSRAHRRWGSRRSGRPPRGSAHARRRLATGCPDPSSPRAPLRRSTRSVAGAAEFSPTASIVEVRPAERRDLRFGFPRPQVAQPLASIQCQERRAERPRRAGLPDAPSGRLALSERRYRPPGIRQSRGVSVCASNRGARYAAQVAGTAMPTHRSGGQLRYAESAAPAQINSSRAFVVGPDDRATRRIPPRPESAAPVRISERTLARPCLDQLGTSSGRWLPAQRLASAGCGHRPICRSTPVCRVLPTWAGDSSTRPAPHPGAYGEEPRARPP